MSVSNFKELLAHVGHNIECVTYGNDDDIVNVSWQEIPRFQPCG